MRRPTTPELAFVMVGAATCVAFVFLSVPLWREYHAHEVSVAVSPLARGASRAITTVEAAAGPPRRVAAAAVTLRLEAARGSCWIMIRSTSNKGAVRYAGTLEQGATLRARGARLWVSLGAAGNLDATLNGKRLGRFPTGTIDLIVTDDGVRHAPPVAPAERKGRA